MTISAKVPIFDFALDGPGANAPFQPDAGPGPFATTLLGQDTPAFSFVPPSALQGVHGSPGVLARVPGPAVPQPPGPTIPSDGSVTEAASLEDRLFKLEQRTNDQQRRQSPASYEVGDPTDMAYLASVEKASAADRAAEIAQNATDDQGRSLVSDAAVQEVQAEDQGRGEVELRAAAGVANTAVMNRADQAITRYQAVWDGELLLDPASLGFALTDFHGRFDMLDCAPLAARFGIERRNTIAAGLTETAVAETLRLQDVRIAEDLLQDQRVLDALSDDQRRALQSLVNTAPAQRSPASSGQDVDSLDTLSLETGANVERIANALAQEQRLWIIDNVFDISAKLVVGDLPEDVLGDRVPAVLFPDEDDPVREIIAVASATGERVRRYHGKPLNELRADIKRLESEIDRLKRRGVRPSPLTREESMALARLEDEHKKKAQTLETIQQQRRTDSVSEALLNPHMAADYRAFLNGINDPNLSPAQRAAVTSPYLARIAEYHKIIDAPVLNILPADEAARMVQTLEEIFESLDRDLPRDDEWLTVADLELLIFRLGDAAGPIFEQIAPDLKPETRMVTNLMLNNLQDVVSNYMIARDQGNKWVRKSGLSMLENRTRLKVKKSFEPYEENFGSQESNKALFDSLINIVTLSVLWEFNSILERKGVREHGKYRLIKHGVSQPPIWKLYKELVGRTIESVLDGVGTLVDTEWGKIPVPDGINHFYFRMGLTSFMEDLGPEGLDLPYFPNQSDDAIGAELVDHLRAHGRWQIADCGRSVVLVDGNNEAVMRNGQILKFDFDEIAQKGKERIKQFHSDTMTMA